MQIPLLIGVKVAKYKGRKQGNDLAGRSLTEDLQKTGLSVLVFFFLFFFDFALFVSYLAVFLVLDFLEFV